MKKITIKQQLKLLGGLLVLLSAVVIFGYWQNVFQTGAQSSPAPAAQAVVQIGNTITFNSSEYVSYDPKYDGKDITVTGASTIVTLDGKHRFNSVTVKNGGKLTHSAIDGSGKVPISDYVGIRWKGFIKASGSPTGIFLQADDAVRIKLRTVGQASWRCYPTDCTSWENNKIQGVTLPVGLTEMQIDFVEKTGDAWLTFFASPNSQVPNPAAKTEVFLKQDQTQGECGADISVKGFCGEYYSYKSSANDPFAGEPDLKKIDIPTDNGRGGFAMPFGFQGAIFSIGPAGLSLDITGDLTLDGGQIDVSGKGYNGGDGNKLDTDSWDRKRAKVTAGYGPGGAPELTEMLKCGSNAKDISGGGGGYGGQGGINTNGVFYSMEKGGTYGERENPQSAPDHGDRYKNMVPATFGSGGAGGVHIACVFFRKVNFTFSEGGAGGGSIIIQAQKVVIQGAGAIYANGANTSSKYSGAGSGGLIYIKADEFSSKNSIAHPIVDGIFGGTNGTYWVKEPTKESLYGGWSVTANGGGISTGQSAENPYQGGGGGGRVVIDAPVGPASTTTDNTSQMLRVEVTWPEGTRTEMIDLKTLLRDTR